MRFGFQLPLFYCFGFWIPIVSFFFFFYLTAFWTLIANFLGFAFWIPIYQDPNFSIERLRAMYDCFIGNLNAGTSCLGVKCCPLIGHLDMANSCYGGVRHAHLQSSKFKVQNLFMTWTHKGMANIQIQHTTHIKVVRQAR